MAKKREIARIQRFALDSTSAEGLFATVDETGHTNAETAKKQRARRRKFGSAVAVDPLSLQDPSGSNVEKIITITAVSFVALFFVLVVATQVATALIRRTSTANLATEVSVKAVGSAMSGGVEWGNGFTQFPERFSVQEADENTHRIEVTVTDTTSRDLLEVFAGSQIQAAALAVNALLNPNINTVIYHVQVHYDENGKLSHSNLFGILPPQGVQKTLMTFVWTKTTTKNGVRFHCTITGVDKETADKLRTNITSSFTPSSLIGQVLGTKDDGDVADEKQNTQEPDKQGAQNAQNGAQNTPNATSSTSDNKDTSAQSQDSSNAQDQSQGSASKEPSSQDTAAQGSGGENGDAGSQARSGAVIAEDRSNSV